MKRIYATLMVVALLIACNRVEQPLNTDDLETSHEYSMTINAGKDYSRTKALDLTGSTLSPKWADGEEVAVFNNAWASNLGTLTAAASDDDETTLSGTVTIANLSSGDRINLLFPRASWRYSGQIGVLSSAENSIEKKYDYAWANPSINIVGNDISASADLAAQQAIVKFTLRNEDNTADVPVTRLNISAAGRKLVQSRGYGEERWEPEACEEYNDTDHFFYLELPNYTNPDDIQIQIENPSHDWLYGLVDGSFGTDGYKVIDGNYVYRIKNSSPFTSTITLLAPALYARVVSFTNGAYYKYVISDYVSKSIPEHFLTGMQSRYDDLTITPTSSTNTLYVAMRNDLAVADTYTLNATDGNDYFICISPSVQLFNGQYYEITAKMRRVNTHTSLAEGVVIKVGDRIDLITSYCSINGSLYNPDNSPYTLVTSEDGTKYMFKDTYGNYYWVGDLTVTGASDGVYVSSYNNEYDEENIVISVHEP